MGKAIRYNVNMTLHFPITFSYVFFNYDVTSLEDIHPITFRKYTKHPIKVILKNQHVLLTHFRPIFHLRIQQVVGFYWQNVTLP